ncbi:DUF2690 domain-containing protein [Streptomyces sp. NPDC056144]|uniref:DUF2690 domain-containing protein n=1 Tax=unclassified Streptomyces TaxID=2593676 RepID=UPI0035D5FCEB
MPAPGRRPHARPYAPLLASLTLLATLGALSVPSAGAAEAQSCRAETCNGLDPLTTHCDIAARTVKFAPLPGGGRLELRWSNMCQANWARVSGVYPGTPIMVENTVNDWQGATAGSSTYSHTPMVDGTHSSRAGADFGRDGVYWTLWA